MQLGVAVGEPFAAIELTDTEYELVLFTRRMTSALPPGTRVVLLLSPTCSAVTLKVSVPFVALPVPEPDDFQ